MTYPVYFSDEFKEIMKKLKKKNPEMVQRINKIVKEIRQNPEHYKPLRNILKGKRRKQIGHFVLTFSIRDDIIYVEAFGHHDKAYL